MLDLGLIAVGLSLLALLIEVAAFLYMKKTYLPLLDTAQAALKTGMSAMGIKGAESRAAKQIEQAVTSDIMRANIPELSMLIEYLSPETMEMIEANPEVVMMLVQKWGPMLEKIAGKYLSKLNKTGNEGGGYNL